MENESLQQDKNRESEVIREILTRKIFDENTGFIYMSKQQPRTLQKKIDFVANLNKTNGNISLACKMTGIKSRKTIYNWIKLDPELRNVMSDMNELEGDLAEDLLKHQVFVKQNLASIRYFLNKKHPKYMIPKRSTIPPRKTETQEQMWKRWERMPWPEDEEKDKSV